ncbi:hypothetical protein TNCV_2263151 [Trichonephila clavipes]|nr:hypothetical protein TNCV_2263151 [Trichonephila clavipes]
MQILSELDILDPLESTDAFDQLMSFVFGPQELQLLHTVPSIFDGNLLSFLDEFERAPMDLTMSRLNFCVKKSIGFKAIQPIDLSVNSTRPVTQVRGIPTLLREGQVEPDRPRRPHCGQRNRTTKHFPRTGPWRRCLNSMSFTMEPFPTPCTRTFRFAPSYQCVKYLQEFNKLQAEWSHKVSIL